MDKAPGDTQGTLGTFGGVFTPSVLTILGLVLFLRVAYVVGSVGLVRTLAILGLSTLVSVLTSISLAVVATNLKVRGGGEYFLISRTLGIEFGGAVGLVLYLAISVSIAFYAIGFSEAIVDALGRNDPRLIQLIAAGLVLLLTVVSYVGADLATRLQYLVMGLLAVALVSFFVGAIDDFSPSQLSDNIGRPEAGVGFWEAFAVFFPAVTGFSQGVAMSGDLKSPQPLDCPGHLCRRRVLDRGVPGRHRRAGRQRHGHRAGGEHHIDHERAVAGRLEHPGRRAGRNPVVGPGIVARRAPRTAAARRGPRAAAARVLLRGRRVRQQPAPSAGAVHGDRPDHHRRRRSQRRCAGHLHVLPSQLRHDQLRHLLRVPGRKHLVPPRFRWGDHRASLAGTIACGGAIIAINPLAGTFAALVLLGLYTYLRQRDVPDRWVDSAGSHHYTRAREHLHSLADEPMGSRDWRPCILAFVPRDPVNRRRMILLASWLEGDSGFLTAVRMLEGSGPVGRRQAHEIEEDLAAEVDAITDDAFARVLLVADDEVGVQTLVQAHGLGNVRANLTVFGVHDLRGSEADRKAYGSMLQNCVRFGANVAVINVRDDAWEQFEATPKGERSIALWWSDDQVGQLITLLGWLCQRHTDWSDASIVVYVPAGQDESETARIAALLEDARIEAEVVAVDRSPAAFSSAMGGATLALAPLRVRRGQAIGPFETPLGMLAESLPLAVMILATESLELDAQPDETKLAELARATDRAREAAQWVSELDREAAHLLVEAEALRVQLDDDGLDPDRRSELETRLEQVEADAAQAYRRYVDARARSAVLESKVEELESAGGTDLADPDIWRSSSTVKNESADR